ncbi:GNAT family N-acetyltransferase [Saccharospirillum alexandrii]|uniref:GNAT family N-acetyltransferase n=1 Tax=Saccharospirillum alexandrii TaxID=2448477 RepID=UPI0037353E69
MNTIIREARIEDLDALYELNSVVHDLHVSFNVGVFKETDQLEVISWFKEIMTEKDFSVFVVELNGEIAGYILCKLNQRPSNIFLNARSSIYVEQIAVSNRFQRLGISKLLFERVFQYAKKNGISKVQLDVWSKNEAAHQAFEKLGFKTYNQKMELELE